jgi:8-oxo-dGTP pyrophosphatase MutT (NUDIX family)
MTVVVAIIEQEGRVPVCRRRHDQQHGLKWEFPGGKLEPGEKPAEPGAGDPVAAGEGLLSAGRPFGVSLSRES